MPLLERGYRTAAVADLERNIRMLENAEQKPVSKEVFNKELRNGKANIEFAERIRLITAEKAAELRDRMNRAALNFEKMQRNEFEERVDDIENPRERAARYQDMDSYNAQILQERARADHEKNAVTTYEHTFGEDESRSR